MRIVVVANKSWEADALVGVLNSEKARPNGVTPKPGVAKGHHLTVSAGHTAVEVWCIQYLLPKPVNQLSTRSRWLRLTGRDDKVIGNDQTIWVVATSI